MDPYDANVRLLGIGGLPGAGQGIADYSSWLVAAAVMVLLAGLAWWTMRPSRRTSARPPSAAPRRESEPARDRPAERRPR